MIDFVFSLYLLGRQVGAQALANRVRPRVCEADLKAFDSAHVLPAQLWLALHAHVVLPSTADLFIWTEDAWAQTPRQRFERAFVVDEILALVARGGAPPFKFEPTEYASWQAEVWPTSSAEADREARIMVDRLEFDGDDRVTGGEFVLVVPTTRSTPAPLVLSAVDHARAKLGLPSTEVRGITTTQARQRRLYLVVDQDADPRERYRVTLSLMKAVNERLAHARSL